MSTTTAALESVEQDDEVRTPERDEPRGYIFEGYYYSED